MPKPPVIFLAFANDHQNYLYKLTEEQNAIRSALSQMKKEGLCEVVYETDTDLDKIWRTFNEYKDRIAIFHYGGHAEDYSLLLQRADGQQQLVDGEGLVSFLSRQRGLQLVFINGCSSKRQAEELRDRGVPAVIGTLEPIDDEAATRLSKTFYESLATGRSIQQAWMNASDMLRADQIKKQEGYYRGVGTKSKVKQQKTLNFPWELYIKAGAENVKDWNIPAATRNPLFGLGLPEEAYLRLPNAPFLGLHFFREDDAPIFFGRGTQIRELYNHLQGIHPIILLYGKSGVGKSSMLDAGLRPRIKDKYQTVYARRNQDKGLLGTLDIALKKWTHADTTPEATALPIQKEQQKELLAYLQLAIEKAQNEQLRQRIEALLQEISEPISKQPRPLFPLSGVLEKWQRAETESGKPLLVILDQVEEKFTRPMPEARHQQEDELLAFLLSIQPLFGKTNSGIKGKLILSYRKEYHPEIRDAFHSLSLPYTELFLKRLDRKGIMEAIEGVNQHKYTRERYQLQIQAELPVIIADDLLEDQESPIAPVLQIILAKLWSTANPNSLPSDPTQTVTQFTIADYQRLKSQGTTMGEFFQQQMEQLNQMPDLAEMVDSGLALDVLAAHTTPMGTAGSRHRAQLRERYDIADESIDSLLLALEDLSLLSRFDAQSTILAHDTLAPVVIREYNLSDAPGQRAVRILKNKISEVSFQLEPTYLENLIKAKVPGAEAQELKVAHKGSDKYMTALQASLGTDRWQGDKKEILNQHTRFDFGTGYHRIYLDQADLSIVEEGSGEKESGKGGMRRLFPEEEELIRLSQARRLKRQRQRKQWIGIGLLGVATIVGLMIFAFAKMEAANRQTDLSEARRLGNLAKTSVDEGKFTDALHLALAAFQKSESKPIESYEAFNSILNAGFNYTIPIVVAEFDLHANSLGNAVFSPDGQYILTESDDNSAKIWKLNGKLQASLQGHTNPIKSLSFSPDGKLILTQSEDNTAKLWDFQGNLKADLNQHTDTLHNAQFSPDGQRILTHSKDRTAKLWDLKGELLANLDQHSDDISAASFSPDGQFVLTHTKDNIVQVWNLKGQVVAPIRPAAGNITSACFSSDGENIIIVVDDQSVQVWDLSGNVLIDFNAQQYNFTSIKVSPDRQHILTLHDQCMARLWDISGKIQGELNDLQECELDLLNFFPGGQYIYRELIQPGKGGSIELWNLQGKFLKREGYGNSALGSHAVKFSPSGKYLIGPDNFVFEFDSEDNVNLKYIPELDQQYHTASVAFSHDEQYIINLINNNTAILWRPEEEKPIANFYTGTIRSASLSPDGQYILSEIDNRAQLWKLARLSVAHINDRYVEAISPDGQLYLVDGPESRKIWEPFGNAEVNLVDGNNYLDGLARFARDSQLILSTKGDSTKIWDFQGQIKVSLAGDKASFSPDDKFVLTSTSDSTKIWNLQGQTKASLAGGKASFSPNGKLVLTSMGDSTKSWDLQGQIKASLAGNQASFSPNGKLVLTSTSDSTNIWDLQGQIKASLAGNQASFSPNGKLILTRHRKNFKIWDLNGKEKMELSPQLGRFNDATFSPDGQYIGTITEDRKGVNRYCIAELWNLKGQQLARFDDLYFWKRSARLLFSPDGRFLVTTSEYETKIWPTPPLYKSWVDSMNLVPLSEEKLLKYRLSNTE